MGLLMRPKISRRILSRTREGLPEQLATSLCNIHLSLQPTQKKKKENRETTSVKKGHLGGVQMTKRSTRVVVHVYTWLVLDVKPGIMLFVIVAETRIVFLCAKTVYPDGRLQRAIFVRGAPCVHFAHWRI